MALKVVPRVAMRNPYTAAALTAAYATGKLATSIRAKRKRVAGAAEGVRPSKYKSRKVSMFDLPTTHSKHRIGADHGIIDVSKGVKAPGLGCATHRRKMFGSVENHVNSKMCWIGASDIGDQAQLCKVLAQAVMQYYMRRVGDQRNAFDSVGSEQAFTNFRVRYTRSAPNPTMTGTDEVTGAFIQNSRLDTMSDNFAAEMFAKAEQGYYPSAITFRRDDLANGFTIQRTILNDEGLSRHKINLSVNSQYKIQNVTPTEGTTGTTGSINDINANPLTGKVFTFRNQRPLFREDYLSGFTDPTTVDGIKHLNRVQQSTDVLKAPSSTVDAFAHIAAPPIYAKTLWRNAISQGAVSLTPGGYKHYSTKFGREGTLRTLLEGIVMIRYDINGEGQTAKFPPMGSSFMMCLQPVMRTSASELVKIAYDGTLIYKATLNPRRVGNIPTRTFNQA